MSFCQNGNPQIKLIIQQRCVTMTKECIVVIKIGFIIMGDQLIVHPMPFSIFLFFFFFALVVTPSQ